MAEILIPFGFLALLFVAAALVFGLDAFRAERRDRDRVHPHI